MAHESAPSPAANGRSQRSAADVVRLSVPCSLEYVRLIRLTASSLANRLGFDLDEIDDLRVAVDELASTLVDAGGDGLLEVSFHVGPDAIEIEGRTTSRTLPVLDELTVQILAAVVDNYEVRADGAAGTFRCTKRTVQSG